MPASRADLFPYRFRVTRSAAAGAQPLPDSTFTAVIFDTVVFANVAFNTATGAFTAPMAGYYQLNFNLTIALINAYAAAATLNAAFFVNGVRVVNGQALTIPVFNVPAFGMAATTLEFLNLGDVVTVQGFQNSAVAQEFLANGPFNNNFSGHLRSQ